MILRVRRSAAALLSLGLPLTVCAQGAPKPKPSEHIEVAQWNRTKDSPIALAQKLDAHIHALRNVQCDGKMNMEFPSRNQRGNYELHASLRNPTTFKLNFAGFNLNSDSVLTVNEIKANGSRFTGRDMLQGRLIGPLPISQISLGKKVTSDSFAANHTEAMWGSFLGFGTFGQVVASARAKGLNVFVQMRNYRRLGKVIPQYRLAIESPTKNPRVAPRFRLYVVADAKLLLPLRVSSTGYIPFGKTSMPFSFTAAYAWKKSAKPLDSNLFELK